MRTMNEINPISAALYFVCTAALAMFCMHPAVILLSVIGSFAFRFAHNGRYDRTDAALLALFAVLSLLNPLANHNGRTVLFVINDSPITAEALFYGIVASAMLVSVVCWFRAFTKIMTSDKLLYLFGRLSPKLSLVLSMGLRYTSLLNKRMQSIRAAQTALGLYGDSNIVDRVRGELRVLSILITWALENGIITADSMEARGYGTHRRTHFALFRFRAFDIAVLCAVLLLFILTALCIASGALDFEFYPSVRVGEVTPMTYCGLIAYFILVMLPTVLEVGVNLKWKYLRQRI